MRRHPPSIGFVFGPMRCSCTCDQSSLPRGIAKPPRSVVIVLRENLSKLQGRSPDLVRVIEQSPGGFLAVTAAKNGMPTARVAERWIHSLYDPQREAEQWAEQTVATIRQDEILVICGVGLMYHLEALCRRLPPHVPRIVPIPDGNEWRDALAVRSIAGWGESVQWLTGSAQFVAESMLERMRVHPGSIRIVRYEPAARLHERYFAAVERTLSLGLARRQSGRLRIAVVGPIYGGSLPIAGYVARALESLGHEVQWIDHSVHGSGYKSLDTIRDPRLRLTMRSRLADTLGVITLARIAELKPDLVLALSQAPLSLPILKQLQRKQFLTAMWFVENYRHLTYWQQVASGYDFWFVMQRGACFDALTRAGARHVCYLPLAADPSIHRPLALSRAEREEFGADVSFVGAGYENRRILFSRLLDQPWKFKIWGNEWEHADALRSVIQRDGARIDTETCVKIFNATSVNLNIHSYREHGFDPDGDCVNPRTFELAACGAFQIVDHRSLLSELFDTTMLEILTNPDDLSACITRCLHDPERRQAMAAHARAQVLAHHTYEHRMKTLLAEIGLRTPDRIGEILRGGRNPQALLADSAEIPELRPLIQVDARSTRVELEDLARVIRAKGPMTQLSREELLILMMDAYRQETRDIV